MRKFFLFFFSYFVIVTQATLFAQTQNLPKVRQLYQLPQNIIPKQDSHLVNYILAGTESGLYKIIGNDTPVPLWTESRVTQILYTEDQGVERWFFVTGHGLMVSEDLLTFTLIGSEQGLPMLTLKTYDGEKTNLIQRAKEIKDVAVHPQNTDILVATTDNTVYLSQDGGTSWKSLGFCHSTAGAKAVAVADLSVEKEFNADGTPKTELTVFVSHSINGIYYIQPNVANSKWTDLSDGFDMMPTHTSPDEISDIVAITRQDTTGVQRTEIYISQTFLPNIFRLNWEAKCGERIYHGEEPADTIDGLFWTGTNLLYTRPGGISLMNLSSGENTGIPSEFSHWQRSLSKVPEPVYSAYIPRNLSGFETSLVLNELWMLKPEKVYAKYASDELSNVKALYVPANIGRTESGQKEILETLKANNLNGIVIDMKDDAGLLRYDTKDPTIQEKCFVSRYAVDLDNFVERFKAEGIYLIARIVVFKDKHLSEYGRGKYAVWNKSTNRPWIGTKGEQNILDENGNVVGTEQTYYDENWVDPYCHEVWEYNVAIAKELIARGFDEIQFDYIRFPTDGKNLWQASYRWQDTGMDKESALISFLSYARENLDAPIGIDIYGANGWYRSGTRTGQDVELLSEYVDVICPMFYPSHFGQGDMAHAPAAERPYRIYYYGTYRNSIIARNKSIIRPWAQAFYLGVSYDKRYYDEDYVQRQIFGVRDSANRGYMYWNNVGRYEDIRPDIEENTPYPWDAFESSLEFRKPALTGEFTREKNQTEAGAIQ
ncbi:MAG: hypothetical protein J6B81_00740 [Spirochaetaceae bacterium]|nr:hypothetical protein [Spirochaetaceae bacterium]